MKKILLTLSVLLVYISSYAQTDSLKVYGTSPKLYLYHTVQKGDNYYSLGRQFHLRPQAIAAANDITFKDQLEKNQLIKIPLNSDNFSQQLAGASAQYQPVFRRVYPGETLYRISLNNNKVPVNQLRSWNHLSGNNISPGQNLIVGWIKADHSIPPKHGEVLAKATPAVSHPAAKSVDNNNGSGARQVSLPLNTANKDIEVVQQNDQTAEVKPAVAKAVYAGPEKPAETSIPVNNKPVNPGMTATATVSPEPEKTIKPDINTDNMPLSVDNIAAPSAFEQEYLISSANDKNISTAHGAASWFRSNIQPGSKKYYALYNAVPRGTIIKVTNPINGKAVFVKVLSTVPDLKENANVIIKISDAAMQDLGISDQRFYCQLSYPKQAEEDKGN